MHNRQKYLNGASGVCIGMLKRTNVTDAWKTCTTDRAVWSVRHLHNYADSHACLMSRMHDTVWQSENLKPQV